MWPDWGQIECLLLFSNRSLRGWYFYAGTLGRGGAGSLGWGSLWPAYTDPSCASQQQAVRRSRHTTAQYSTHIITLGSWRRAEKRETSDLYYNKSTTPLVRWWWASEAPWCTCPSSSAGCWTGCPPSWVTSPSCWTAPRPRSASAAARTTMRSDRSRASHPDTASL